MILLYVNDVQLDLFPSTTVALSRRVANIGNFNNRNSSFTNKFTVPLTGLNRAALGILQINTTSRTPYEDVSGKLVTEGIEVISNVRVKIVNVTDVAELELKVDNGNLFDLLKKTKLRSLDLRDYDHRWNQSNIVAARDNVWTDCYTYPLFQNSNQSTLFKNVDCKGLIPFVYAKFLLQEIAARFGYTLDGDGYTDLMMDQLYIPIVATNNDQIIQNDYLVTSNTVTRTGWEIDSADGVLIPGMDAANCAIENLTASTTDRWDIINTDQGFDWAGSPVGGFDLLLPGTYRFKISYTYTLYDAVGSSYFAGVCLFVNDNDFLFAQLVNQQTSPGTYTGEAFVTISTETIIDSSINNKEFIYGAGFSGNFFEDPDIGRVKINYSFSVELVSVNLPTTFYNRPISISPNLPDWDCGKFFKEVANLNASSFQIDEYTKVISMFRQKTIADNKSFPFNWSDKLTVQSPPQFTFTLDGFGKITKFSYKDFNLYSFILTINNEQLPEDQDYIESAFVPCEQRDALLLNNIVFFDAWNSEDNRIELDGKVRIALNRTTTGTRYNSPNQAAVTPSGNNNVAYFDDPNNYSLDWADLYVVYFAPVLDQLTPDILVMDANFLLNALDIQTLDFSKPVYLNQYGAYFFINEVKEFTTPNETTSVTLVRI
jgi:hypothetical protein